MTWSHPHDGRLYLLLAVGLVGLLVLASRFAAAETARARALLVLRALALGVLFLILLNPIQVRETTHRGPEPAAVFLLDESRSMSLEKPHSRAQTVERLIRDAEAFIPADRRPAIHRFGFGRDLVALREPSPPRSPTADETRLAWGLEELPSRFGEQLPFGVFVFSDGRSTERTALEPIARAYRDLGVPLHVVPVGDPRISGDVAIQDIDAPRDAQPRTRVSVRVTVRSRGYDGQRTQLLIKSVANPRAAPVASLPITLSGGEEAHDLVVDTDRAKGPLTVEVAPLPHESIAANNVVPFAITVREPQIRVIYMEGSNPPEYKYVQDALEEDPNIKCVSMYVDNQYVTSPVLHRIGDPGRGYPTTRAELLTYDVVICSDVARFAFTPQQLEWTVELVNKHGGGFAMVGGHTSFGSGGWDQTVWDGLIPVDMSGNGRARSPYYDGPMRVVIPPSAERHPIWRIVDDPVRNRKVLDGMPHFNGTNLIDRLKPAAVGLGFSSGPLPGSSAITTVFSCQSFGRGRTFAMATDTTYAWGTQFETTWGEGDNRYFRKFWRNVVRWLSENSKGASRRLRVETDKFIYRPGQPVQVKAAAYDDKLEETDRYRIVARLRPPGQEQSQDSQPTGTNLVPDLGTAAYRGTLPAPPVGETLAENPGSTIHELVLDAEALDGDNVVARSSVPIQVIDDPVEFRDPRPDSAELEKLARAASGKVIHNSAQLGALLAQHPDATVETVVTRTPLWDTPLLWLLFVGLLTSEWIVRRMKGLA